MTEEELSDRILSAKGPCTIVGGGTRRMQTSGEHFSTAELSGITLYEPGALTMVARAGTPVTEVEAALDAENQRLAFEPFDYRIVMGTDGVPQIGSVFATNNSGSRRFAVGAARDFLLGVRFVDGSGRIIKNGGRVMKNVTGYDLVKLLSGSYGTLGVLTEVSFKVLPIPETESSLVLHQLSDRDAVAAMSKSLSSPYEVTGAVHDPLTGQTVLRLEGFADSVTYRIEKLQELLGGSAPEVSVWEAANSSSFWKSQRNLDGLAKQGGDVWKVSCKPSDAPSLAEKAAALSHSFDWGGGLIWIETSPGTDLRARLGAFDGHATIIRASETTTRQLGRFHPEAPGVARIAQGLRDQFDPRGILNPGLMDAVPSLAA